MLILNAVSSPHAVARLCQGHVRRCCQRDRPPGQPGADAFGHPHRQRHVRRGWTQVPPLLPVWRWVGDMHWAAERLCEPGLEKLLLWFYRVQQGPIGTPQLYGTLTSRAALHWCSQTLSIQPHEWKAPASLGASTCHRCDQSWVGTES